MNCKIYESSNYHLRKLSLSKDASVCKSKLWFGTSFGRIRKKFSWFESFQWTSGTFLSAHDPRSPMKNCLFARQSRWVERCWFLNMTVRLWKRLSSDFTFCFRGSSMWPWNERKGFQNRNSPQDFLVSPFFVHKPLKTQCIQVQSQSSRITGRGMLTRVRPKVFLMLPKPMPQGCIPMVKGTVNYWASAPLTSLVCEMQRSLALSWTKISSFRLHRPVYNINIQ
jgi:hypothetical protein